jgi:two-component system, NarL family, response regulator NreC
MGPMCRLLSPTAKRMKMGTKVVLADDHQLVRDGLRALLEKEEGLVVCGEASNGREAVELCSSLHPDILVVDVTMPELNGIEAARQISQACPGTRIIALSVHVDSRFVAAMVKAGASAYLPKHCAFGELTTAIREVTQGRVYLSPKITGGVVEDFVRNMQPAGAPAYEVLAPRERQVLQLLAEGKSTKEIAAELHVSIKTVEWYRREIMTKLNIETLAGLVKFAIREGLTSSET